MSKTNKEEEAEKKKGKRRRNLLRFRALNERIVAWQIPSIATKLSSGLWLNTRKSSNTQLFIWKEPPNAPTVTPHDALWKGPFL
jgi:hypothetical protein